MFSGVIHSRGKTAPFILRLLITKNKQVSVFRMKLHNPYSGYDPWEKKSEGLVLNINFPMTFRRPEYTPLNINLLLIYETESKVYVAEVVPNYNSWLPKTARVWGEITELINLLLSYVLYQLTRTCFVSIITRFRDFK